MRQRGHLAMSSSPAMPMMWYRDLQFQQEARRYEQELEQRLGAFGLTLDLVKNVHRVSSFWRGAEQRSNSWG